MLLLCEGDVNPLGRVLGYMGGGLGGEFAPQGAGMARGGELMGAAGPHPRDTAVQRPADCV